jgi:benzoyl-CoA reductase/2-hydroxyglutaryl-CoA dehydratase subunit BcrC/BadD/HgdB
MGLQTGHKVTTESLQKAIRLGNLIRTDMAELDSYLAQPKVPIASLEYYLIQMMMGDYAQDPEGLHNLLRQLLQEIKLRVEQGKAAPGLSASPVRVYILGDETQELAIFNAIDNYGGVLVGCDFRWPLYYEMIDEEAPPLASLARWIWRMPSNIPTRERVQTELISIKKQRPDALIISSVVGCRYFPGAERMVRESVKQELGIPVLGIETTLAGENVEKVDYQIRALLQTIGG